MEEENVEEGPNKLDSHNAMEQQQLHKNSPSNYSRYEYEYDYKYEFGLRAHCANTLADKMQAKRLQTETESDTEH